MNTIKAEIQKSEYGYIDYLQFVIDGTSIDEVLEVKYPDNYYRGLVPTINSWMENEKERKVVWNRIIPEEGQTTYAPILMCPDDCDFSCIIIIAEITKINNEIIWNKLGLDQTEFENNYPNAIGTNVKWFDAIGKYKFDIEEYTNAIKKFELMMSLEDIEWTIRFWLKLINEEENIPNSIIAVNFGIIENEDEFQIYLIGSKTYDQQDEDWACQVDYEPQFKYRGLGKLSKLNSWEVILGKVKESLEIEIPKLDLFKSVSHITTGFDGGDLIALTKETGHNK